MILIRCFEQVQALIELIKLHDESIVPGILDLLSSADEDVRAESARALGYLGNGYRERIGPTLQRSSKAGRMKDRLLCE